MTLELLKDLLEVAESVSKRIELEGKLFDELLEDNYGLPKGLCLMLDTLVDVLDKYCGGEWASWWCFDNNYGANCLTAGVEGNEQVIDSVDKLYELIKDANG